MAEPRYFFLRGFMKSGTNWAGKLLNSHPEISCIGEYHWERILAPTLRSLLTQPLFTQRDNFLAKRTHENMETMVRTTMRQAADPQATVIGAKEKVQINRLAADLKRQDEMLAESYDEMMALRQHLES